MSQNSKLLLYFEQHGSITTREAMLNLGIYRVSERIREIERLGWVLKHEPVKIGKARVMRYTLMGRPATNCMNQVSAQSYAEASRGK